LNALVPSSLLLALTIACGPAKATVHVAGKTLTFKGGKYVGGVLAVDYHGKAYLLRGDTAKITLTGGRTRGSFTASILFGSGSASGTFSC
jgi:hypothetical protein